LPLELIGFKKQGAIMSIKEFFEIIFAKNKRNKNVQNLLCYSIGQPLENFMDESSDIPLHIIIAWLDGSKSNYKKFLREFDSELFINYLATDEYFRTNCTDIYYALKEAAPDYFPDDRADFDSILEDICLLFTDITGITDDNEPVANAIDKSDGKSDSDEVYSGNKKIIYTLVSSLICVIVLIITIFAAVKSFKSYDDIDRSQYSTATGFVLTSSAEIITTDVTTSDITIASSLSSVTSGDVTTVKTPSTKPVTKKPTTTKKPTATTKKPAATTKKPATTTKKPATNPPTAAPTAAPTAPPTAAPTNPPATDPPAAPPADGGNVEG
jgi:hypothetical protein